VKKALFILLILLLLVGCSVKDKGWTNPVPADPSGYLGKLLNDGWTLYSQGNFEASYAKFDSFMLMNADSFDGYIGRGFNNIELGATQADKFDEGDVDFKFALYLLNADNPMTEDRFKLNYVGLRNDSLYYVLSYNKPILYIDGDVELVVYIDTLHYTTTLSVHAYLDTLIQVATTTKDFIVSGNDTLFVPGDPSIDSCAFFAQITLVDSTLNTNLPSPVGAVLTGLCQLNQARYLVEAKDKYIKSSIQYGELVRVLFSDDFADGLPEIYDGSINRRNALVILAQDFFYAGDYYNALWRAMEINPDLSVDSTAADFVKQLQRAIENL